MQQQRDRGRRLKDERPLVVENKQIVAGALSLQAAASPGPGGFRNSYIQAVAEYPGGAEALRRWCNMVTVGEHACSEYSPLECSDVAAILQERWGLDQASDMR